MLKREPKFKVGDAVRLRYERKIMHIERVIRQAGLSTGEFIGKYKCAWRIGGKKYSAEWVEEALELITVAP